MTFRPMLASSIKDMSKLDYPLYASIKYDGIRCTMQGGVLLSRTLKPIPNKNVQEMFKNLPEGLDGELMVGDPFAKDVFQRTTSVVMSHDKPATGVKFYVFDQYLPDLRFVARKEIMDSLFFSCKNDVVKVVQHVIDNEKELLDFEEHTLANGFEGLILRSIDGPYKEGRSTEKQGWLLKLKRFVDAEAEVIDFYEEMENTNEAKTNLLGRTERSTKKEGMVGKGRLGGFVVIGLNGTFEGIIFECGSGLTAAQRESYWDGRMSLANRIIKYKYFPIGVKDKPRLPIFLGFRDKRDI